MFKHGMRYSKIYRIYYNMMQRCYYPKYKNFKYWGGRGITVCDRWKDEKDGLKNFINDLGEPLWNLSLDRINNDGNYELKNVRWATKKEQKNNSRKKGTVL